MSRLLALYPARWRERYGEEFLALLAARPPDVRDRIDIVRGAIDAHRNPQLVGPVRTPDRLGWLPMAGFGLFLVGLLVAANGPVMRDAYGTYRDGWAALPFIVLAAGLLGVGLVRLAWHLPSRAVATRTAGVVAALAAFVWSSMPWLHVVAMVFLVGVAILAAGAYRSGIWPAWLALVVGTLVVIPSLAIVVQLSQPWYANRADTVALFTLVGSIAALWPVLGLGLLRGFVPQTPD